MHKILLSLFVLALVACSPSKKSSSGSETSESIRPAGQDVAPGHAMVAFSVKEHESTDSQSIWVVEIEEVMAYGPSTPTLASGVTVRVDATTFLKYADPDHDSEYYAGIERLEGLWESAGEQIGDNPDAPAWRLVRILEHE